MANKIQSANNIEAANNIAIRIKLLGCKISAKERKKKQFKIAAYISEIYTNRKQICRSLSFMELDLNL